MTPRNVSKITTRRYLLKRANGSNGHNAFHCFGVVAKVGSTCTMIRDHYDQTGPQAARWLDVTHQFVATEYVTNGFDAAEVANARANVQNELTAEALTTYDALTDVAEAREIPGLVHSVSSDLIKILRGLRGHYNIRDLRYASRIAPLELLKHPDRILRKLGDEWMQYRYGIMPLVYSYRDACKTVRKGKGSTTHKKAVISPKSTGVSLPGPTASYLRTDYEGKITISGSYFQYFEWSSDARLAGVGFNPLVTAWELIPYSFVVDWFVDVGSYISAATSQDLSKVHYACISQRSDYVKKTWAHYPMQDKTISFGNNLSSPWVGSVPPATPSETISRPEELQLYKTIETNAYERTVFDPGAAPLTISPSFNWRRLVDSAVMVLNNLGTLNKFLKGH